MITGLAAPFPVLPYLLHTIIGTLGVVLAFVALGLRKGSRSHKDAGRGFVASVAIAALTAILFGVMTGSPLTLASALLVLGLVVGAIVALRPRTTWTRVGSGVGTGLVLLSWLILLPLGLFGVAIILQWVSPPAGVAVPQLSSVLTPLVYSLFPAWFLLGDLRFRRLQGDARRVAGIRQHLSKMAFALAVAVHAPAVTFADDFRIPLLLAFFGPLLLWPAILYALRDHPLLQRRGRPAGQEATVTG